MSTRTIEIAGGGVAGLSLAVALASRGVSVNLREAGTYPRHRLCGEFINGVEEKTLQTLALGDFLRGALIHQEMSWWSGDTFLARSRLLRPVPALSRWEMDQRLVSLARAQGAKVIERERVSPEARDGHVWTTGRRLQKDSPWLGLKAHYFNLKVASGLEMHLGKEGYLGLTPVEGGRVNVCGLFRRQPGMSGKRSGLLENYLSVNGLHNLRQRLLVADADESSVTGVSGIAFGAQGHDQRLLALGDGERIVPPFTGNGMSMALEAAECALEPLLLYASGAEDWREIRQVAQRHLEARFRSRLALAKGLHGLILNPRGQHALALAARSRCLPFSLLNRFLT